MHRCFKSACWSCVVLAIVGTCVANEPDLNAVKNGNFENWISAKGEGVTTTSKGVPVGSLPDDWYGGPGVGGTATYNRLNFDAGQTDVPGNPGHFMRVHWLRPPSQVWPGEGHHQPSFRFTFLEYFGIRDVRAFTGETVVISFYARVDRDTLGVVPIMWHSYDATTAVKGTGYELFESSGKSNEVKVAAGAPDPAAVCDVTSKWKRFERELTLPSIGEKKVTAGHYTGIGFDTTRRFKGFIDIANVRVTRVSVDEAPGKDAQDATDLPAAITRIIKRVNDDIAGRSDEEFYDRTLPVEIPVVPYQGKRYESLVPDTEDLAEYGVRAINAATRLSHPELHTVPQLVYSGYNPSIMQLRDGSLVNITPKWAEALPMLRVMSGSTLNLQRDGKIIGTLVNITGKDGLCYQPLKDRPWAVYDEFNRDVGRPFPDIFGEGRQLLAYAAWYQHDKNPLWKRLAEKKIKRLAQLTRTKGDTLFFPSGRGAITPWSQGWPIKAGEPMVAVCDVPASLKQEIEGGAASYIVGFYPQVCVILHRLFGDENALKLGGGLARYLQLHGKLTEMPTGRSLIHHEAHLKHSLLGNLPYALYARDHEMIKWVMKGFEHAKRADDPDQIGIVFGDESSQPADMIQIGLMLSRAGVGDYWEDMDRWIRNTFLPMQIQAGDVARVKETPVSIAGDPQNTQVIGLIGDPLNRWKPKHAMSQPLHPSCYQPKDGADACLGAWFVTLRHRGACTGGGIGNSWRALYYIWDSIIEPVDKTLRVNLLFNRASPWADIDSYIPYEGKAVVRMKTAQSDVLIRIPEWTDWNRVSCHVNGRPRECDWHGSYRSVGECAAGDEIVVEFPMKQWVVSTIVPDSDTKYEVTLKGNTVIDTSVNVGYPLFVHEKYREEKAGMRKVNRFVSDERFKLK